MEHVQIGQTGVLSRDADVVSIRENDLVNAPQLVDPHVIFYGPSGSNYDQWLLSSLMQLHVMKPYLPSGTRLLIPNSLLNSLSGSGASTQVDFSERLNEWGFGDFLITAINAPICHITDLYWLDECRIERFPSRFVQASRAELLSRIRTPQNKRLLYIRRSGKLTLENQEAVESAAVAHGFSLYSIDDLTVMEKKELFSNADFIISSRADSLGSIIYCAEGTKVLEILPETEFRPALSQLCDKLGLTHGVLPCATSKDGSSNKITVDLNKFQLLIMQMNAFDD